MTQITGTLDTLETLTVERNALLAMGDNAPLARKRAFTSRCIAYNNAVESKSTDVDAEIPLGLVDGFNERALIDAIKDGHEIGVYRTESSFNIELLTEHYRLRNARYSDMPSTSDTDVATVPEPRRKWKDRKADESFLAWHVRLIEYKNKQTENTRAKRGGLISATRKLEVSVEAESTKRYLEQCKLALRLGVDITPSMLDREEIEAFVVAALAQGAKGQILALKSGLVDANLLPAKPSHSVDKAESILALLRGCFGKSISSSVGKVKRPNYFDSELALSKALQYARFIQEERINAPLAPAYGSAYHVRETPMQVWTDANGVKQCTEPWLAMWLTDKTNNPITVTESRASATEKLPFWEKGLGVLPNYDLLKSLRFEVDYRHEPITLVTSQVTASDVKPIIQHVAPCATKLPLNALGRADGIYTVFPRPNVVVTPSHAPSAPSKGTKYNPAYSTYRPSALLGAGRMF